MRKPILQIVLKFLAFTCTISNLLNLPVLHLNLQDPRLPETISDFSSFFAVLVTSDTNTSAYIYLQKPNFLSLPILPFNLQCPYLPDCQSVFQFHCYAIH